MTPRELHYEHEAAQRRWRQDAERDLVLSWNVARFASAAFIGGKLPDLRSEIDRLFGPQARKTPSAQRWQAHVVLGDMVGIPSRPISEEAKRALMRLRAQHGE